MEKYLKPFQVILVIFVFTAIVNCQEAKRTANVANRIEYVDIGTNVSLLCIFEGAAIQLCNFQIPGFPSELKLDPKFNKTGDYFYHGEGLNKGQCGVTLEHVTKEMAGDAICRLDMNDGSSDVFGTITLKVFDPLEPRSMTVKTTGTKSGEEFEASCPLVKGNKSRTFWFMGTNDLHNENDFSISVTDTESTIKFTLKPEFDKKNLFCRTYNKLFPGNFQDISVALKVKFAPQPWTSPVVFFFEASKEVEFYVKFKANPKPDILWLLNENVLNQSDTKNYLIDNLLLEEKNLWKATLTIKNTVVEPLYQFKLVAKNEIGERKYDVNVQIYDVPTTVATLIEETTIQSGSYETVESVSSPQPPISVTQLPTTIVEPTTTIVESPTTIVESPTTIVEPPRTFSQLPKTFIELPGNFTRPPISSTEQPSATPQPSPVEPSTKKVIKPSKNFIIKKQVILAQENSPVEIICISRQPIVSCAFEVAGYDGLINATPYNDSCGIVFENFNPKHYGKAYCIMTTEQNVKFRGSIEIRKPPPPKTSMWIRTYFESALKAGDKLEFQCGDSKGAKNEKLLWYIDGEYVGLGVQEMTHLSKNIYMLKSTYQMTVKSSDHGKTVACISKNSESYEILGQQTIQLFVNFSPEFIAVVKDGLYAALVKANPKPTFKWIVDGETLKAPEKFKIEQLDGVEYSIKLLEELEYEHKIELKVENKFGPRVYTFANKSPENVSK